MGSIYDELKGFGKRKRGGTVVRRKKAKRMLVRAMVKKLKAEGKAVDLQAVNREALDRLRRRHQTHRKRHK
jgi:hypothetical protein